MERQVGAWRGGSAGGETDHGGWTGLGLSLARDPDGSGLPVDQIEFAKGAGELRGAGGGGPGRHTHTHTHTHKIGRAHV